MATPAQHISQRERRWIIATVMLGTVSTITAATIVNVAFPALIAEFRVGHDTLQWWPPAWRGERNPGRRALKHGAATAFQECFWVVTIAFAAATAATWSIRRHRPENH
jgi:hypothetical protein